MSKTREERRRARNTRRDVILLTVALAVMAGAAYAAEWLMPAVMI